MAKSKPRTTRAKRPVMGSPNKNKKTKQPQSHSKGKHEKHESSKNVATTIEPNPIETPPCDETLRSKSVYYETESVDEFHDIRYMKNGSITHKYLRKKAMDRLDLNEGDVVVFPLCCIGPQIMYVGRLAKIITTKTGRIKKAIVVILGHKKSCFEYENGKKRGDIHKIDLCLTYTVSPIHSYDTKEVEYDFRGGLNFEDMSVDELKTYVESHQSK